MVAVPSPCVGICRLDACGKCVGCFRTLDEIARWPEADDRERQLITERASSRRSVSEVAADEAG